MTKQNVLVLFFLSTLTFCSNAQRGDQFLIAKLYDKSEFHGVKIDENDDVIRLRISTKDTIHIDRRFTKHVYEEGNATVFSDGKYFESKGYFWTFAFGSNFFDDRVSSHLEFLFAQRLNQKFSIGFGTGFEFNEAEAAGFEFDTQFSTIFAYGRYNFNQGKRRVFAFGRIGNGFSAEENMEGILNEQEGGVNGMFGLGLHFASRSKSKFQLILGQYFQKASGRETFFDNLGNEVPTTFDLMIKRMILKFGWEFG